VDDGTRRVTPAHTGGTVPAARSVPLAREARGESAGRVAVVGGGWAGLAAAVTLAQSGRSVTVFEQARTLGGRARRVERDGLALDNGQHVLAGAYRQTLELIATVHGATRAATLLRRLPLTIAPFGTSDGRVRLRAWRAAAPLHLVAALATARGLSWPERRALVASYRRLAAARFQCPPAQTVAECFAGTPRRVVDAVWAPLALAALNTPPERASAQMFATVVGETFAGPAAASEWLVPACDLSALFPQAAARFVAARGGDVRTGTAVRALQASDDGVVVRTNDDERFAAALIAVGPHQLGGLAVSASDAAWRSAVAQVAAFRFESITTVYIAYPAPVRFPAPIARLDDAPGQWAFDRSALLAGASPRGARSLVAVVASASGALAREAQALLAQRIDAQLRRLLPSLPAALWSRVIAEQRATYACTPALPRPRAGRVASRLYLAGDYTDERLPPTLEAATRSGVAAARALAGDLALRAR
jgi:squalene-associated FAD-dependent desaturase